MKRTTTLVAFLTMAFFALVYFSACSQNEKTESAIDSDAPLIESEEDYHERMAWWNEARFGLFIHWGLYAIPAGEWGNETNYGEWIRTSAQIPLEEYDKLLPQFNPVKFNAEDWVRMAKGAGMKYIVITSKHHDGFALFDSKVSDFDVMSTPFQRDILKELAEACNKEGIKLCFYHSIMDWHHPDYLPHRVWEKERSTEGADYDRYVTYMKGQLEELLTNYGDLGVLWFDGEWESTWDYERGQDLYNYVKGFQHDIIINNRVDVGRRGMEGTTMEGYVGDFGTPEQEIPDTGLPAGTYWETCMTMNDHWGYNKHNDNWKTTKDLIHKLTDIASKGGNFLLNVGPTAEGLFPRESIDRLKAIGDWMDINGESIYNTQASPVKSPGWGRLTYRSAGADSKLYVHVFERPASGEINLGGLATDPIKIVNLANPNTEINFNRKGGEILVNLPEEIVDEISTVLVFSFDREPEFFNPPEIIAEHPLFIHKIEVELSAEHEADIHYTTDGSKPSLSSPIYKSPIVLGKSATIKALISRNGVALTGPSERSFEKVPPRPAIEIAGTPENGLKYTYFEGKWDALPDFENLKAIGEGKTDVFSVNPKKREEEFGLVFEGLVKIPAEGIYAFSTISDDGSALYLDGEICVDNDGLHGAKEVESLIALSSGFHRIRVEFFENTGGDVLQVKMKAPKEGKIELEASQLFIE